MTPSPQSIAAHAENLRSNPLVSALDDLVENAGDRCRIDTSDGRIAGVIFERLFTIRAELEPLIERLARKEAEDEARVEAEIADYDARWMAEHGGAA